MPTRSVQATPLPFRFLRIRINNLNTMELHECNLNIRYDLPKEIWNKMPLVYEEMDCWLGYGNDKIPYWYSFDENEKSVYASVEASGLHFVARMEAKEWREWISRFKMIASEILDIEIVEVEDGF